MSEADLVQLHARAVGELVALSQACHYDMRAIHELVRLLQWVIDHVELAQQERQHLIDGMLAAREHLMHAVMCVPERSVM